jgi:SAM-dependent methyltransferase
MTYSRTNPSQRYVDLQKMYRSMHQVGATATGQSPEQTFPGMSLLPHLERIRALIGRTGARNVLDYGCGKGQQYAPGHVKDADGKAYDSVIDLWDVDYVHCYDPCHEPYSKLPEGRFDAVICTDVLEHCPEQDVPWILDEIFAYAERCVYASIACYPAKKHLPNGENAHCTIRPVDWWREHIRTASAKNPEVVWEIWVQSLVRTSEGERIEEQRIGHG